MRPRRPRTERRARERQVEKLGRRARIAQENAERRYAIAAAEHERRYLAWVAGGRKAPPPPRPVRPHTPGWGHRHG